MEVFTITVALTQNGVIGLRRRSRRLLKRFVAARRMQRQRGYSINSKLNSMVKRFFFCALASALLALCPPARAQSRKPSQALKQVADQQKKLLDKFDKEVEAGRAQAYEASERTEALRAIAAERAAGFRINDWKDDELIALATLYQWAEAYNNAAEAYREYLKADAESNDALLVRLGLTRALIETDRIDEARKSLEETRRLSGRGTTVDVTRIGLAKDIAMALRDRGNSRDAAALALEAFRSADLTIDVGRVPPPLRETVERDRLSLAALVVATRARLGQAKEAAEFDKAIKAEDFKDKIELRAFYESELTSARLLGRSAPELVAERWLGASGVKLVDLRGKVLLLDFWAMWCGPCIAAHPRILALKSQYAARGLAVIGVTRLYGRSDTEEDLSREQEFKSLERYTAKYKLDYPVAVGKMDDITNDEQYGVVGLPMTILLDRQGRVRFIQRGVMEHRKLERQLIKLLDEK